MTWNTQGLPSSVITSKEKATPSAMFSKTDNCRDSWVVDLINKSVKLMLPLVAFIAAYISIPFIFLNREAWLW